MVLVVPVARWIAVPICLHSAAVALKARSAHGGTDGAERRWVTSTNDTIHTSTYTQTIGAKSGAGAVLEDELLARAASRGSAETKEALGDASAAVSIDGFIHSPGHSQAHRPGHGPGHNITTWGFNCRKYPELCEPPFQCRTPPDDKVTVATSDGHPDYKGWCSSPYAMAALQCAQGNLTGYSHLITKRQHHTGLRQQFKVGKLIESFDAHYCFAVGHCDDDNNVTESTTTAQMEEICDSRFGSEAWRKLPRQGTNGVGVSLMHGRMGRQGAYLSMEAERRLALMACAMGNFHCDTVYCRLQYCGDRGYVAKFDRLRPAVLEKQRLAREEKVKAREEVKLARQRAREFV